MRGIPRAHRRADEPGDANGIGELLRLRGQFEQVLGQVIAATSDAIFMVDSDLLIRSWSEGAQELYGYTADEIIGRSSDLLRTQDLDRDVLGLCDLRLQKVLDGLSEREKLETRHVHKDGTVIDALIAVTPLHNVDGVVIGLVAAARDVTDVRRAESRVEHLATHDALTGLFNRTRFDEELSAEVIRTRTQRQTAAVLMLDLDNFKYINDTYGHSAGDEIVAGIAMSLQRTLRDTDVLARFGGDEFAVLTAPTTREQTRELADRLLAAVSRHGAVIAGIPIPVTASIGVVSFGESVTTAEELLVDVDCAVYQSKETGRDRVTVFEARERELTRRGPRTSVEHLIHDALEQNLFELYVQPIVNLHTDLMTHCEVLLRIVDGETVVAPGEFLPTAERVGLIHEIDRWVIDHAFELAAKHPELTFEVNLSGSTIDDDGLADHIVERLIHHRVDPAQIVFELTETVAVSNIAKARDLAQLVVDFGCAFAIDDFGAGFSTFYYLKHFPAKYVKIDGEFLSGKRNRTDDLVIESIVRIARDLGKETIAEYVSDADRLRLVKELGVDYGQGYHFSEPFPSSELASYPRRRLEISPEPSTLRWAAISEP